MTHVPSPLFQLGQRVAEFARDRQGLSAVEFALLLPVMLTLYLGGTEVSQAVATDRKVTITARTVADLASRVTTVSDVDMTNILAAATAVLAPYAVANAVVTVSQVKIDGNGNPTIDWSDAKNGSPRPIGQAVPTCVDPARSNCIPTKLVVKNTWLLWGETQYSYTPTIGYVITGTLNLHDQIFMGPRLSNSVTRTHP